MLVLIITTLLMKTQEVEAVSFLEEIFGQAGDFIEEGKNGAESEVSDDQTAEIMTILYNVLLSLGSIIAVGIGGSLGIKFMTASAEDKAKVKESMIPYVAGTAVIFGALAIWKLAIKIFSQI